MAQIVPERRFAATASESGKLSAGEQSSIRRALPMMVVTRHIEEAAALATNLVALEQGHVVAQGPFAQASCSPQFQALLDARDTRVAMLAGTLRNFNSGRSIWLRANQILLAADEPRSVSARNVIAGRGESGGDQKRAQPSV